jgi:hypothetical protein
MPSCKESVSGLGSVVLKFSIWGDYNQKFNSHYKIFYLTVTMISGETKDFD